ncbi:MAG: LptF/LptG family permease [Akkermansiaceae bacterium]
MLRVMDRYIGKQIIAATIFGVAVLSVLLVMGNLFKELQSLLVEDRASLSLVAKFVYSVLPFSLIYTIPWGFLVAVLLVFGRLSAANELISMRMAGVGLFRIAMPVYVIGALLCCFSLWLNVSLAPKAKNTMKSVLYQAVKENPLSMLQPGVVQVQSQGQKIFIESRDGDIIKGLHMHDMNENSKTGFPHASIYAREARLKIIEETKQIRLKLKDAYAETKKPNGIRDIAFMGEMEPLIFDFGAEERKNRRPNSMTNAEIRSKLQTTEQLEARDQYKLQNEMNRRYAFSMSCLALSCIAVPLGISGRRKETSSGLGLSVLVALGYFLFFMVADEYEDKAGSTALMLYWLPNVVCLILGIKMFFKARRK